MDSLSLSSICFQVVSPKQMDNLSLPLITFQTVSPKQRTAWVYLSFSQKCHPLLYQKTRCRSIFRINIKVIIPRFGGGRSVANLISRYVGWRDVAQFPSQVSFPVLSDDEMSKMSSPVCLVQRCHRSKCLFLQTISLQIHSKFPNTTINTVVNNHYSPVKLQYLLAESDPFLQRIWVSLFFQNKSSLSFYIHN